MMENNQTHRTRPLWLPDAKKLVDRIDVLQPVAELIGSTSLEGDLKTLKTVGLKLRHFTQSVSRGTIYDNPTVRHELRNLTSAIIGYSEFVLEEMEQTVDGPLYDSLQTILALCHQLSAYDDREDPLADTTGPSIKTIGGTILIVDDQQFNIEAIKIILKFKIGIDTSSLCDYALNGKHALDIIYKNVERNNY